MDGPTILAIAEVAHIIGFDRLPLCGKPLVGREDVVEFLPFITPDRTACSICFQTAALALVPACQERDELRVRLAEADPKVGDRPTRLERVRPLALMLLYRNANAFDPRARSTREAATAILAILDGLPADEAPGAARVSRWLVEAEEHARRIAAARDGSDDRD